MGIISNEIYVIISMMRITAEYLGAKMLYLYMKFIFRLIRRIPHCTVQMIAQKGEVRALEYREGQRYNF